MFSKASRANSLAARLSAWYAASAFVLLVVATAFLYWVLLQSFGRQDEQYLTEKMNVLRALLRERDFQTIRWEAEGEASARPGVNVLCRVATAEGGVLVETNTVSLGLPPAIFAQGETAGYRTAAGRVFRLRTERAHEPSGDYTIQVALEVTQEQNLLAVYRRRLWGVLIAGLLASVLVGWGIAKRGIRPLKDISQAVGRIGSSTLNERISSRGYPSELLALASMFNGMMDRLEDAFARLAQFSSDIAHEFRTPMSNLRGELEVALTRARSPEEYRDVLGSALEECQRLSRLVESLLFLARAENPRTQIRRDRLDVGRELSTVADYYDGAASDAGVSLLLNAPGGLVASVDPALFQRAIGNLVDNALTHTPPGGTIRLDARGNDGSVLVSVSDTGTGISPEHLPHVFERFYRGDPARTHHEGGAGLGLAIVRSVATLHGGKAEIESEPGRGTRVTLTFSVA